MLLAGCSTETVAQMKRLGLPEAASDRAPYMGDLWIGSWIAAGIVGVTVWGAIFWVWLRYRGKDNAMPKQNRYNLPMEIFYTLTPFIIVGVLFYYTIIAQNAMTKKHDQPEVTVTVLAYKWSWVFKHESAGNPAIGTAVWEYGTIQRTPTLVLPVGKKVRFNLQSADVIHDFWVPSFYQKLDVVPGRLNSLDITPTREGEFKGKCAELCGTYHSAMLFNVRVVSEQEYNQALQDLKALGQIGEVRGPANVDPQGENAEYQGEEVGSR